ncbi:MAG: DUF4388 domain-containing protein [Pyrinomonadaceae bacterium]
MALTGHLSDLSLSELIEFFCNQRKAGQLKVLYPQGAGYFYLQTGSVIDARIGCLRGIDAVYHALTLPNADFEFSGSTETVERTINQPWTQVVLEGLRRLDEGLTPTEAFPAGYVAGPEDQAPDEVKKTPVARRHEFHVPAFLTSFGNKESVAKRKPLIVGAVVLSVVASVGAIGVPAGWYNRAKVSVTPNEPNLTESVSQASVPTPEAEKIEAPENNAGDAPALEAKRQREKDRARVREDRAAFAKQPADGSTPAPAKGGPKKVAVTVAYDESGRVVQASGADASALRIARQKRFPPGKAGSATVTIPIN